MTTARRAGMLKLLAPLRKAKTNFRNQIFSLTTLVEKAHRKKPDGGGKSPSVGSTSKQANTAHTIHPRLQRARLHGHLARHCEPGPQRDHVLTAAVLDITSSTFAQFECLVPLTSIRAPAGVFNATCADFGFSNPRTWTSVPCTAFELTIQPNGLAAVPLSA